MHQGSPPPKWSFPWPVVGSGWRRLLIAVCLALMALTGASLGAWAALPASPPPAVNLHQGPLPRNLLPHMEILPDPTGQWTIAEVRTRRASVGFKRLQGHNLQLLDIDSAVYWLRFRISRPPDTAGPAQGWLLEFSVSHLEQAWLYAPLPRRPGESGVRHRMHAEAAASRPGRGPVMFRHTVFALPSAFDSDRFFYVRLQTSLPVNATVMAYGREHLQQRSLVGAIAFGALYGIMLAMIITNLSMFFSLRDRVYLYYVFYIAAMLLYSLTIFGQVRSLLNPPPEATNILLMGLVGCVFFFAGLLTRTYLGSKVRAPGWDKAILAFMALALAQLATALGGLVSAAAILALILGAAVPVIGVAAWFACLRGGFKPSWFFLAAWLIFLSGAVIWELRWLGLAPVYVWSDYGFVMGTSLEAVLLSFAMGQKVRDLRQEKEALATSERRYQKLSVTDGLTGLYNQRFFVSRLTSEVDHAVRLEQPLALAMLDVDRFKQFNDAHGHPAGDRVLSGLAAAITDCTRPGDYCCRYGGEEFAVILPGAGLADARAVAERIRTSFVTPPYRHPDHPNPPVTVSVGLAVLQPGETPQGLLDRADRALYRAKDLGRNRTEANA